jgi:hypothetical protein
MCRFTLYYSQSLLMALFAPRHLLLNTSYPGCLFSCLRNSTSRLTNRIYAAAAALAAAREVDVPHYRLSGEVLPHQEAVGFASHYAERNTTYLPGTGILPEFLQVRPISAWGEAQVRIVGR